MSLMKTPEDVIIALHDMFGVNFVILERRTVHETQNLKVGIGTSADDALLSLEFDNTGNGFHFSGSCAAIGKSWKKLIGMGGQGNRD